LDDCGSCGIDDNNNLPKKKVVERMWISKVNECTLKMDGKKVA
jgi:hypothetical protein